MAKCTICQGQRYREMPNTETLEALKEVEEIIRAGSGQHLRGTAEAKNMKGDIFVVMTSIEVKVPDCLAGGCVSEFK